MDKLKVKSKKNMENVIGGDIWLMADRDARPVSDEFRMDDERDEIEEIEEELQMDLTNDEG